MDVNGGSIVKADSAPENSLSKKSKYSAMPDLQMLCYRALLQNLPPEKPCPAPLLWGTMDRQMGFSVLGAIKSLKCAFSLVMAISFMGFPPPRPCHNSFFVR